MTSAELYRLLGATSQKDILRHFPVRYESLLPSVVPDAPTDRERIVVRGVPFSVHAISARGTSIIRFKIKCETRILSCILFNQPFYKTRLYSSEESLFVLYYAEARKAYVVHSIHDSESYFAMTGIRPVYALPKGISQTLFSSTVRRILDVSAQGFGVQSDLPPRLIEKYRLLDSYDAYRAVHLPRTNEELLRGLRVFKYEEALRYAVSSLRLRKKADSRKRKVRLPIDHGKINQAVKKLSYKLTHDQVQAVREIILDMEGEKVMYRLLQGDVGTGKTIVSLLALYANVLRKKQGVLMAPTYELALQHYKNALSFFEGLDVHVAFLASGATMKASEKRKILSGLEDGSLQVLVATHAALSKDVVFQSLGLTIIDEQQLFGVAQRDQLLSKGDSDLLMVTATPIPRTLSQIVNADIDVSTLSQYPTGKRNVQTKVIRSTDPIVKEAIAKCLKVGRQVFVVAPKIDESDRKANATTLYKEMVDLYGEENCQLLHGRMKKEEQKAVYDRFLKAEKKILISTTVVEVGIDVSSAALLLVYDANCFGLSSLHQLRGRIGRSGDFALCLLIYDGKDRESLDKLNFLAEHNDGFDISEYDLKMRGAGSYGGERQSGESELSVCNFVTDFKIFQCAKGDALAILKDPDEEHNRRYLLSLKAEAPTLA